MSRLGYWFWFVAILVVMVLLNLARLCHTWKAFRLDGMEQIGFPLVFFERGGFAYHEALYPDHLAIDLTIALAAAYFGSHAIRDALRRRRR